MCYFVSHIGFFEDANVTGRYALSTAKLLPTFRRTLVKGCTNFPKKNLEPPRKSRRQAGDKMQFSY